MFGSLFCMECKQMLKSLVYYIYIVLFVLFITSQMSQINIQEVLREPQPGQEYYGMTYSRDEQVIMKRTLAGLLDEAYKNAYSTYPMGFYKSVTLNEEEARSIRAVLEDCTGKSWEQLQEELFAYWDESSQATEEKQMLASLEFSIAPREDLSYEEFAKAMERVCEVVGKGSSYEKSAYESQVSVPATYQDVKQEYDDMLETDRVTGGYMRLFADYASIVLAILPIFLGVTRCLRDERAKASAVLYSKQVSSKTLILSRYLAAVVMAYVPVALTALAVQLPIQYAASGMGFDSDIWAFLKYTGVWILPELMIVLAISFLITELTGSIVSIFVQALWGLASMMGAATLTGNFGLKLMARWNSSGQTARFMEQLNDLLLNRGYYVLLAMLCVAVTIWGYEKKRREGGSILGKVLQSHR